MFISLNGALACVLAAAAVPAAAIDLTLTSAGIYSPGTVVVTNPGPGAQSTMTDLASIVRFTATRDGRAIDILGFCIDLFHPITVGIDGQTRTNLNYVTAPLTTDSAGGALSIAQVRQIGGLAEIGFGIARGNGPDKAARLAAIQQAIWTIEYPTLSFAAGSPHAAQQGFVHEYLALAPGLSGPARTIYAADRSTQGFVVAGVPEPGTWAMLVVGFGLVGAATRRGKTVRRVAA